MDCLQIFLYIAKILGRGEFPHHDAIGDDVFGLQAPIVVRPTTAVICSIS